MACANCLPFSASKNNIIIIIIIIIIVIVSGRAVDLEWIGRTLMSDFIASIYEHILTNV